MASPITYEFRVAVTGHRTIADEAGVAQAIEGVLDRINRVLAAAQATPPCWTIISPLARGADQIAAKVFLDRAHARLEVLTPFPLAEYRKDFSTDGELASFENLLARAAAVEELPRRPQSPEIGKAANGQTTESLRDAAYLRAGERVVEASEILLAVWDGRAAAGMGGTAEIVEYAIERDRLVLWIDAEHPGEPPKRIHSVSFRENSIDQPGENPAVVTVENFPDSLAELSRGYAEQLAYFHDTSLEPADYQQQEHSTRDRLTSAALAAGLPATALEGIFTALITQFARADALAQLYHRKHARTVSGVPYLAALAVSIAVAQVLFLPEMLWLILFEIAAMMIVLGLFLSASSGGWHEKWLHARYLAEQTRVAMFTTLVEPQSHAPRGGDPLPFYRGPQQWLVLTVRAIVAEASRGVPSLPLPALKSFLIGAWIEDQRHFHERNAKQKETSADRRHQLGFALFGATLLMALLHLAGVGHRAEAEGPRILSAGLWITFLALVLPAWAGAVHAVTSQLELERIAERSHRMSVALEWLAHRVMRASTSEELRDAVNETAELMTMETHEWWVLLSFQGARLHV